MHNSHFIFPRNTPVLNEMYTYHTGSYKILQPGFNPTSMTSRKCNSQENATSGAFVVTVHGC